MYICLINDKHSSRQGNRQRYFYERKMSNKNYLMNDGYSMYTLDKILKDSSCDATHTLEEAQAILKKYNRYRKTGKFYDYGTMHINKISKILKLNKKQLKSFYKNKK